MLNLSWRTYFSNDIFRWKLQKNAITYKVLQKFRRSFSLLNPGVSSIRIFLTSCNTLSCAFCSMNQFYVASTFTTATTTSKQHFIICEWECLRNKDVVQYIVRLISLDKTKWERAEEKEHKFLLWIPIETGRLILAQLGIEHTKCV